MAYGLNTGGGTPEQQQQGTDELGARDQLNKQQQTKYAAQNRMNTSPNQLVTAAQGDQSKAPTLGTSSSPVTADGKINEQNTPQPPPPPPAPPPPPPVQVVAQQPQQTAQQAGLSQALAAPEAQGIPFGDDAIGPEHWSMGPNAQGIYELMQSNPDQFPTAASAQEWGQRYYGWQPASVATAPKPNVFPPPSPNQMVTAPQTSGKSPTPTAGAPPPNREAEIANMMRENPTMFPTAEDARAWGERHYGWGSQTSTTQTGGTTTTPTTGPGTANPRTGPIPGTFGSTAVLDGVNIGGAPEESIYKPTTYTPWKAPNQGPQDEATLAAINQTLNNPVVDVNDLNARSADTQQQALRDVLQGQKNNAAARGMLGGGFNTALEAKTRDESQKGLLEAQRGNRIDAATKNRDYLNQAIINSGGFLNDQMNRYSTSYGNQFKGEAGDKMERLMGSNSQFAAWAKGVDNILQNKGLNIDEFLGKDRNEITKMLGLAGIDAERYGTDLNAIVNLIEIVAGIEATDKTNANRLTNTILGGLSL